MFPKAAVSAIAAPEMPPKIILVKMLTCASPPRSLPKKRLEKLISLPVSPTIFMMSPAKRKKGSARKEKPSIAEKNRWEIMVRKTGLPSLNRPIRAVKARTKPTGMPMSASRIKIVRMKIAMILVSDQ